MPTILITDDQTLLTRYARAADAEAFAQLVKKYCAMVFAVARRVTGSFEDAEDVAQAVFLELAKNSRTVIGSLPAYLHRAATTRALNLRRDRAARHHREVHLAHDPPSPPPIEHAELLSAVDAAIEQLPEDLHQIILLHFLEGLPQTEVALRTGLSEPTISRRLASAILQLRRLLKASNPNTELAVLPAVLLAAKSLPLSPHTIGSLTKIGLSGIGAKSTLATGVAAKLLLLTAATLLAGTLTVFTIKTLASAPSPVTAPTTVPAPPATQPQRNIHGWTDPEVQTASQLRYLVGAMLNNDTDHMPADLGAFLQRIELTPKELDALIPGHDDLSILQKKALLFLPPGDTREIPDNPDRKWINDNSPFIYEGNPNISLKKIKEWTKIVILHEKLDGENAKKSNIVLVYLDAHGETPRRAYAQTAIEDSQKLLKQAEPATQP